MTVFAYAIYHYAAARMTGAERERAQGLARLADAGDRGALADLRDLVNQVVRDPRRRNGNKKL
jgi:hypothetical protein